MNKIKTSRESESRIKLSRKKDWTPPSSLDAPPAPNGYAHRWIRTTVQGFEDTANVSKKLREGWEPCRLEDHPELQIHMMDHNSEWSVKGNVEIGGQLLCKMPEEKAKARDEYFNKLAESQLESVDNTYFKDQDSRMATKQVFERKSRTTFGKDS